MLPKVPVALATAFLTDHEAWLRGQLQRSARQAVGEGTTLPIRGETVAVRIMPRVRPHLSGATLVVPGPAGRAGPQVAAWLREAARAACAGAVDAHAARLGRPAGRISLRDTRSRWGSCTATGDLMFSWRLAMAPPAVLDYVVAHEVAHIAELNHSDRFWAVVRRLCPGFEAERDWLRRNGAALHRYDFGAQPE